MGEKKKLLVTSNFSFSHSVFYKFGEHSATFIKFENVVCKLFQFGESKICRLRKSSENTLWRKTLLVDSISSVEPISSHQMSQYYLDTRKTASENIVGKKVTLVSSMFSFSHLELIKVTISGLECFFSVRYFYTLPNWKSLQTAISSLMKMAERSPNG